MDFKGCFLSAEDKLYPRINIEHLNASCVLLYIGITEHEMSKSTMKNYNWLLMGNTETKVSPFIPQIPYIKSIEKISALL